MALSKVCMLMLPLLFLMVSFTTCASDDGAQREAARGDIFREASPDAQQDSDDDVWKSVFEGLDGDTGKRAKLAETDAAGAGTGSPSFPPGQQWPTPPQTPPVPDRAYAPRARAAIDPKRLLLLLEKINRALDHQSQQLDHQSQQLDHQSQQLDRQSQRLNRLTRAVQSMIPRLEDDSNSDTASDDGLNGDGTK